MRTIGRRTERRNLEYCDKTSKSELVCVYGRRRVGKTFLVEQTFGQCFAFRAAGLENGNNRQQLKSFHLRLMEYGDDNNVIPTDWFEAFARLEKILSVPNVMVSSHGKKVVFLDEFPWLAAKRSDFLEAFGEFWNRRGTQYGDLLVIICGSATSWIIKNVLDATGSLFHRVTCQIFLEPFSLSQTEEFFIDRELDWSREQIMEFQMVFGGLPYFMDLLNVNESFGQNVDRLIFDKNALLRDESNRLLESTLSKSKVYGDILSLLSKHVYGMKKSECMNKLNLADGTFSRAILDLVRCGYVYEYKDNSQKGKPLYVQLIDPFLLFHFYFTDNKYDSYDDLINDTGVYYNWRGHAFEILCLNHIAQIKNALGIAKVKTVSYPWMNVEDGKVKAQIDLVIERADHIINLCEMKCTDSPYKMTKDDELKLIQKRDIFREKVPTKSAVKFVMISAMGLSGNAYIDRISEVITLDDLFGD